jgi:hypothetical protein
MATRWSSDGCSATCTVECGFDLRPGEARPLRTRATSPCGDGKKASDEEPATTATPSMVMGAAALARKSHGWSSLLA